MIEFFVMMTATTVLLIASLAGPAEAPAAKTAPAAPAAPAVSPDDLMGTQEMIAAYRRGRWEDCIRKAKPIAEGNRRSFLPAYYMAASYSHLKDEKRAAEWLERTFEAKHPSGGQLEKDKELAWLAATESGKAVFRHREERVVARADGVLRHQRFDFRLPVYDDPGRRLSPADFRGKALAVVILDEHESEAVLMASSAIQALRDDYALRPFETAAIIVEKPRGVGGIEPQVADFRKDTGWNAASLVGVKEDLFPLEVSVFPAVVFFDAAGTPRFIEEDYKTGQATRYRERALALIEEAERAPAGKKPLQPAGEKKAAEEAR
jgi:hypothetical protein